MGQWFLSLLVVISLYAGLLFAQAPPRLTAVDQNITLKMIPRDKWAVMNVRSAAFGVFDNNPQTVVHNHPAKPRDGFPLDLQLDLATSYDIAGFCYLPPPSPHAQPIAPIEADPNGRIGRFEVYISDDPVVWGSPVAADTFMDAAGEQRVFFTPKRGRYVLFRALSEVHGLDFTSIAEIRLLSL